MNPEKDVSNSGIQGPDPVEYPAGWVANVMRVLCVVAFGVACFLAWSAFQAGEIAGCGAKGVWDCSHVLHSRWSKWLGVPVSVPAAGLYVTMFVALWFVAEKYPDRIRNLAWCVVTVLAVSAGASAVWFVSLQVFILQHLCKYCMAVHSMGLIIFMLITIYQPLSKNVSQGLSSLGLIAASVLIMGQLMTKPAPTYAIEFHDTAGEHVATDEVIDFDFDSEVDSFDDADFDAPMADDESMTPIAVPESNGDSDEQLEKVVKTDDDTVTVVREAAPIATFTPVPQTQTAAVASTVKKTSNEVTEAQAEAPAPRVVTYPGVRANIKVNHWPIIGKPDATQVVICLFDYTCPHCRNMSHHLDVARQRFGQQLAVVVLPVPLDSECNPTVNVTAPDHQEACELARLAVAIWRIDPDLFPAFHSYLFSEPRSRTYGEAYAHAQTMVDPAKLQNMVNGPLVSQFINKHVKLYQRAGEGTLPKVLTEKMTIKGDMANADELCGALQNSLQLQPIR